MTAPALNAIVPVHTRTKGLAMQPHATSLTLYACSICLSVLQRGSWVAAETIIAELRSFERAAPPRFQAAVCVACERSIDERRAQPVEQLAAA